MSLIAVSQRVDEVFIRGELRDALDQRLVHFLIEVGLTPVPIPNILSALSVREDEYGSLMSWLEKVKPSSICLSGGNDIGDYQSRDRTELCVLDYASKISLPVFGVCRGMQVMALHAGARLERCSGHVNQSHMIEGQYNKEVNSFHNYSVVGLPDCYEVIAKTSDGVIEAIRHRHLPWEGWMWHPERDSPFDEWALNRLRQILF